MRVKMLIVFALASLVFAACAGDASEGSVTANTEGFTGQDVSVADGEYTDITVSDLEQMLENKDFVFVNVHIPFEGDIPNTDLSIPYNEIDQELGQLPSEKDARIVLYCRSDRMSTIAAETLASLGYTNVFNVEGGMVAWERAGLPIEGR